MKLWFCIMSLYWKGNQRPVHQRQGFPNMHFLKALCTENIQNVQKKPQTIDKFGMSNMFKMKLTIRLHELKIHSTSVFSMNLCLQNKVILLRYLPTVVWKWNLTSWNCMFWIWIKYYYSLLSDRCKELSIFLTSYLVFFIIHQLINEFVQ